MKYIVVTNGKKFRIQNSKGETAMKFHLCPEGGGYESPWETMFLGRAIKQAARWSLPKPEESWVPVSDLFPSPNASMETR